MSIPFHRGTIVQRGRGIGSILTSLFKGVVPAIKAFGKTLFSSPVTKAVAKTARDAAVDAGLNVAADVLEGRNVSSSIDQGLANAIKRVAATLRQSGTTNSSFSGKYPKKARKSKKKRSKIRTNKDIFDEK